MPILHIYYDYTDPWCFLATFQCDRLKTQVADLEIVWMPFEIFPDLPPLGARPQNAAFLRRKTQYDVDAATAHMDIRLTVRQDWVTNSHPALIGSLVAREHGCFDDYHAATYKAFFEDGKDINAIDVVVDIAGDCGMDRDLFASALKLEAYSAEVVRLRLAAEALGVMAVPTFVCGDRAAVGVVGDDALLRVINGT